MNIILARDIISATERGVRHRLGFWIGAFLVLLLSLSVTGFAADSVSPMPVISHRAPVYVSGTAPAVTPTAANDGNPASMWVSNGIPAWIAYDLSGVPATQRHQVLAAWYAPWAPGYQQLAPTADGQLPINYTIEINAAAGGTLPTGGWQQVVSVTGHQHDTGQHLFNMAEANWVRLSVTASSNPTSIAIDFDIHSAPSGESDSWLFMGDSITGMAVYLFSEIPTLVHGFAPDRWPVVIGAAVGGSNTGTAGPTLDANLLSFTGRYVVLAYGTNDSDNDGFSTNLEAMVLKIIAAGKIPVIPHMPWSSIPDIQAKAPGINARIDALYSKYPIIRHGPDLWTAFLGRTDWIPVGDVHPNDAGNHELRRLWAVSMTADTPPGSGVSVSLTPLSAHLSVGGTTQFSALVSGSNNSGVLWSIQEGTTGGTISSTGLYTAPSVAGTYHVVATSKADPSKSAAASVIVSAPTPVITVAISPASTSLSPRAKRQFSAIVTGTARTGVTWSIQEGSTGGSITNTGLYTAPARTGVFHVRARSKADSSKTAVATVTVGKPVSVSISPTTASVQAGATRQFTANVNNTTTTGVTWSIQEGTTGGTVSKTGLYTAPTAPGTYHVVAKSSADSSKSATATVTVTSLPTGPAIASFAASPASIVAGTSTTLSWSVTGAIGVSISPSVGAVSGTSVSVSPTATTTYTLTATNAVGSVTKTVTVTVTPAPTPPVIASFTASPTSIVAGASTTLSWSVSRATSVSISPSVGAVTGTSVSVSPATTTTYTLTATNGAGSVTQTTSVTVTPAPALPVITSFGASPSSIAVGGASTLSWSVTGATSLSISPSVGGVSGTSISVSPAATTNYILTATNAVGSISSTLTVTVGTATPLGKAPVVRILRDDRVATLEMDFNADNNWGQWWPMTGSGKDDAGFLVTWWPDGASPAAMGQMGGCMGCAGACGKPTDAMAVSKYLVTGNRRVQIQPLANNAIYHVCVERINSLGEVTSARTELTFNGGDSTRVEALRASLTHFDDFNLPMGPADETLWNNASSTSTDPRFNLFFINDQFHAHSLNGTRIENTGDKSQTAQRFRRPIAIEAGVRRRVVFDMDSPLSPRSVWYLDFNPIADDLTGHANFFDEDGAQGLPAGVLRLRSQFQTFTVNLIGMDGASHTIASVDMEANGRQAVSNVRRAFDIRVGTDGISVDIDGKRLIDAPFPAGAFKAGDYSLLWNAFGYNTPKDNNPYYLVHWDNFGFDGPVREPRIIHNYVTRIAGTDYQKSQRWNSTYPTFTIKIPDDLRPTIDNATAEAWLVYTYQMGDYSQLNLLTSDSVQVNGGKAYTLPPPINNSSPLNPALVAWGLPHTARIKLGDITKNGVSPLIVGDNTFKFFADNAGLLNTHVEVFYPAGSEPAYTPPGSIHPVPMHADLPKLGPPARFEKIGATQINRDAYNLDDPANLVAPVSGVVSVNVVVGNDSYADWAPDLMVTPIRSEEVWSTGGTNGISTLELFLRPAGSTGTDPGNRVALIQTNRDAPAPQGRYTMQFDTRGLPNGNYQLFVLATTPTGLKSHPKYNGVAQRWDASQLAGAYYPITIKVQN